MRTINWKHATFATVAVAVTSIALLWSCNTLASLYGGPTGEFRHVIAALAIAFIAKSLLTTRHKRS
jgi:hypothetical protein